MKTLLIVLDGVADRPCGKLNEKTPLEAAQKPNLDKLAANSVLLNCKIAGDIAPESDVGVLSLLGINPFKKHIGRAIFEWLSTGKKFQPGWLAMRANFCTLKNGKIIDRRAGRNVNHREAKALEGEINKIKLSVPFEFAATVGHRGVVVFREKFSKDIQNTDPAYQKNKRGISEAKRSFMSRIVKCIALKNDERTKKSAEVVNEFTGEVQLALQNCTTNKAREKIGQLPANGLLLRDGETKIPSENYSGWVVVANMPLEVGIGKALDMKVVKTQGENYKKAAQIASREILKKNVYVHLKGPDVFGHDGLPIGKKKNIEEIDRKFFGKLRVNLKNVRVIVTADHATPCELKAHSNDAVPALIAGRGIKGRSNSFDEKTAEHRKKINGWQLLKLSEASVLQA